LRYNTIPTQTHCRASNLLAKKKLKAGTTQTGSLRYNTKQTGSLRYNNRRLNE